MKKVLVVLICIVIPLNIKAISASSYIVMDADSRRVLKGHNIDEQRLIASITKIMTAIVTIENGNLKDKVKVDERVLKAYGSAIYIEIGEEITLEDLLYGLMLRSGNDASLVIKSYFEDKNIDIVKLMNDKANKLKMKNTIFLNPHGLEEDDENGNLSTSYDMAILMSYAMKNKTFRKITSTKNYKTKTNMKTYTWQNKNKLLKEYEFCTGGKTGYTKKAKRTLVTSATKDGKNVVIVTLNDGNDFNDHKKLYEETFNQYEKIDVINKNDFKIRNESYYKGVKFYVKKDFKILVTKSEKDNINLNITLEKLSHFEDNQKIGTVEALINNKKVYSENIYIVRRNKIKSKSFWNKIKSLF